MELLARSVEIDFKNEYEKFLVKKGYIYLIRLKKNQQVQVMILVPRLPKNTLQVLKKLIIKIYILVLVFYLYL